MKYVEHPRRARARARFSDILLEGLAPDGGLYVPEAYPRVDAPTSRAGAACPTRSSRSRSSRASSTTSRRRAARAGRAHLHRRRSSARAEITPLKTLEPGAAPARACRTARRSRSRTSRCSCSAICSSTRWRSSGETLNILGATSGDTGSAAEYAMRGKRGMQRVHALAARAHERRSSARRCTRLQDANIHNIAVEGVFDDCQDIVKAVNADAAFKARHRIGAVNSINWARVAAQVVYYFKGYFARDASPTTSRSSFAVPSGNFGNICAGHVARMHGPADPAAGRSRPTRTTCSTSSSAPAATACARQRDARDLEPVDGHLQGVELRALRLRPASAATRARVRDAVRRRLDARGRASTSQRSTTSRASRESGFVSGRSTHADRIATIRDVYRALRRR